MRRGLGFALLSLFGISGLGSVFLTATTHTFGAIGSFLLPQCCPPPNLALYLETHLIDEFPIFNGGVGAIATLENIDLGGALGVLNEYPATIAWIKVSDQNLYLFAKISLGSRICHTHCSVWNIDLFALLNFSSAVINVWFKDLSLPGISYGRADISIGCIPLPLFMGIDVERINSQRVSSPYLALLLRSPEIVFIPKLYFNCCGPMGFGFAFFSNF